MKKREVNSTNISFVLSGASGGSVGNAAYFNLLRAKQTSDTITLILQRYNNILKQIF
jgi:hypothetical protein